MRDMDSIDREKVFWRNIDGRTVVQQMDTGSSYELEGAAEFIWNLLAAGKNFGSIVSALALEYGIEESIALKDLRELLEQFQEESLIDRS